MKAPRCAGCRLSGRLARPLPGTLRSRGYFYGFQREAVTPDHFKRCVKFSVRQHLRVDDRLVTMIGSLFYPLFEKEIVGVAEELADIPVQMMAHLIFKNDAEPPAGSPDPDLFWRCGTGTASSRNSVSSAPRNQKNI